MGENIWSKNFVLFILVALGMSLGANMLNSPLPVYALHIGANNATAGLITGLFALSSCICRPIFGNLIDRRGRFIILFFGITGYALITFGYNFTNTILFLLIIRFMQGISMSAYTTALGTIAADLVSADRLIEGFGYYNLVQTIASSVGPMIGLYLIANSNYHLLFSASFLFALLSLVISFFIQYKKVPEVVRQKRTSVKLFEKSAVPVTIAVFFVEISAGSVMTFISPYAASRGINNIGIYFTVNALMLFVSRIFIAKLVNCIGTYKVIVSSLSLVGISMIVLYFSTTIPIFLLAAMLNGLGAGILFPVLNTLAIKFCEKDRRGTANATYYIGVDVGIGGGSVLGGFLSQLFGYAFLYLLSAVCVAAALGIYFICIRKQMLRRCLA